MLIPLPSHTRGHACVAVDAGDHWVLHCGAVNHSQLCDNQARIAELFARGEPDLMIVCAHDAAQFDRAQDRRP